MNSIRKTWNDIKVSPKTAREFGYILAGVFLILPLLANSVGVIFAHRKFHYWPGWPIVSAIIFLVDIFVPWIIDPVYRVSMFVTHGISWVVMRIVLGILFYLVISPMSIVMRVFGKDVLDQNMVPSQQSYWKKREGRKEAESYEHLF